jgi:hypothetical protein
MSPGEINTILWRLDRQDEQLRHIAEHVERTNGRVTGLELWRARLDGAKAAMGWVRPLVIALGSGGVVVLLEHFLT